MHYMSILVDFSVEWLVLAGLFEARGVVQYRCLVSIRMLLMYSCSMGLYWHVLLHQSREQYWIHTCYKMGLRISRIRDFFGSGAAGYRQKWNAIAWQRYVHRCPIFRLAESTLM